MITKLMFSTHIEKLSDCQWLAAVTLDHNGIPKAFVRRELVESEIDAKAKVREIILALYDTN